MSVEPIRPAPAVYCPVSLWIATRSVGLALMVVYKKLELKTFNDGTSDPMISSERSDRKSSSAMYRPHHPLCWVSRQ